MNTEVQDAESEGFNPYAPEKVVLEFDAFGDEDYIECTICGGPCLITWPELYDPPKMEDCE